MIHPRVTTLPVLEPSTRPTVDPPAPIVDPFEGDPGDPDLHAHIVDQRHPDNVPVDVAVAEGLEVTALCGYRWVPTMNHAMVKPVCKACSRALAAVD